MKKLIEGVAFNSGGKYKVKEGGIKTRSYVKWRAMIMRCYQRKYQADFPHYRGVTVCDDWLDFQNFSEWFYEHEYHNYGYELDKDILTKGSKVYSPETCCFIPQELNALLTNSASARGELPQGVHFHRRIGRYAASLNVNYRKKHLGYFDCPNEAHQVYKKAKEEHVRVKAMEWRGRIEPRVFISLMMWELKDNETMPK